MQDWPKVTENYRGELRINILGYHHGTARHLHEPASMRWHKCSVVRVGHGQALMTNQMIAVIADGLKESQTEGMEEVATQESKKSHHEQKPLCPSASPVLFY